MTVALLDVLTAQPSYSSALRRLIRELAIAGRLLPQTSTWAEHRLSEIVSVRGGSTPSMARPEYWGGDVPWVSPKDMHVGDIVTSEMFVTQEALAKTNLELVPLGSVLIVGRSGILRRKLPAQVTRVACTVNQDIKALTPKSAIESAYLRLWLLGSERAILAEDVKTGTTVQSLVFAKLFARRVQLPPVAEQRHIVAKVDELMALCDRLEAEQADAEAAHAKLVEALLASLTQARDAADFRASWQQLAEHFHTLFTTDASVDALKQVVLELGVTGRLTSFGGAAQWRHIKLGSVAKLINGDRGTNYPNRSEYVPEGIPFINTGHINPDGSLDLGAMHYLTREKFESLRSGKIEPDDLVYCLRGATLGKTAFVRPFSEGAIASSLVILRFEKVVLPEFAYYFLVSPPGRRWIWKFDNGSAQPNLAASSVREYEMPLPSLEEQQKVVRRITDLLALCDQLKLNLAQASRQHEHLASVLVEQAVS